MAHEDPAVNTQLIRWLQQKYGKLTPLTVHRGAMHEYLGMTLDFSTRGTVVVTMPDSVTRLVNEAPEDFGGEASTSATKHLFHVADKPPPLDESLSLLFHHLVAKTVFLANRAPANLQLAVGFLSTRVTAPT